MPRRRTERKVGGYCKIRKRGCSSNSTSSSSLVVKNYRLKRAILVGKRAGSTTPVPTWKMAMRSPSLVKQSHGHGGDKGKEAHTSARRLAASLWEINGSQSPAGCGDGEVEDFYVKKNIGMMFGGEFSPLSKNKDGSKRTGHRRKSSAVSQKLQLTEYISGGVDSVTNGASIELTTATATVKTRLKDVSYSLAASKEIVKVLFRLWSQEEQNSSRLTLASALRVEIERARQQVEELIHEQRHNQKELIDDLLRQFAAEKSSWKNREEERVFSMGKEVEIERKMRRQSERLNKRLGRELAETRGQLAKAVRAREVLEKTFDNDREEVEREREMLQLADVLREERVQMKLSEARYEFEEKNAELERLRSELLGGKESEEEDNSVDSELHSIELNMDTLNKSCKWSFVKEQEVGDQSRRPSSVDEVFKGRRSLSEQIQWENICLQRKTSDGIEWDFTINTTTKQGERSDHKLIKASSSRPESPLQDPP